MASARRLNPAAVKDFAALEGKTSRMVALGAGLSESYLSELLSGSKPGSPKAWKAIADDLGVNLHSITMPVETAVA